MTYTYGYLKDAILAKMDLTSSEANELSLLNKIPFYANEALAQITFGIKPKQTYFVCMVKIRDQVIRELQHKYDLKSITFLGNPNIPDSVLSPKYLAARREYDSNEYVGTPCSMPDKFISWNQNVVYREEHGNLKEVDNSVYNTYGSDSIIFLEPGLYHVPYNTIWGEFSPSMRDDTVLNIPADIMEAIPSFVASQLFKIDDEQKSSIYRNEFELALARIDDNMYTTNRRFTVEGDW